MAGHVAQMTDEKCIQNVSHIKPKERENLRDVGGNGEIILKSILEK